MRYVVFLLAMTVAPTEIYRWADHGFRHDPSMDALCKSFTIWQEGRIRAGEPEESYAKTGMEIFCPAML